MLDQIFGPLAARWAWVALVLRVQKRFGDVRGNYLASAVTLNLFLSLFPALLVAFAVIGYIFSKDNTIADRLIDSLGLSDTAATNVTTILKDASANPRATSIFGLLGLLWSGLGVVAAIDYALDSTWQHTGRGILDRLKGIYWGAGALIIFTISLAITAAVGMVSDGVFLTLVSVLVAVMINILLWLWTFTTLSNQKVPWKAYLPGAILAGLVLEVLKQLAGPLGTLLSNSSTLYQGLGTAFAILAALFVLGRLLIYSSVLNVVLWEDTHGTVTVDIEVPKVPGEVPLESDRSGAVEP